MEIDLEPSSSSSFSSPNKLIHNQKFFKMTKEGPSIETGQQEDVAQVCGNSTFVEGSSSGSLKSEDANNSDADMALCSDNDGDDGLDEGDDLLDYDDEAGYTYYDDDDGNDDDDYLKMQAQFDNLPPGVEASVSWLNDPSPCSSNSNVSAESSLAAKLLIETEAEFLRKFQEFKRFDSVADFSDHHFANKGFSDKQQAKSWSTKVQQDWKILEEGLPDTIYVRVYETRMDLLRAVIVGPAGTPYHDGLFVFDAYLPPSYPSEPPMVHYHSGGLRINPNLYNCGKVCLSLLNTWHGSPEERWNSKTSTMLQVFVSIQALILNVNPFFNEPGYEKSFRGQQGQQRSKQYNENVFILSLRTMLYTLKRPPKHFEELVSGHFRLRSFHILSACKAYLEGAEIGSENTNDPKEAAKRDIGNHPGDFKGNVSNLMNSLITIFASLGAQNCEQFRINVRGSVQLPQL